MRINPILFYIITTIMLLSIACSSQNIALQPATYDSEIVDRHDLSLGEDSKEPSIVNASVDGFIKEYNAKQSDPRLRVADGYRVEYDDFSNAYHVIGDSVNLTVREKDGKFLFAGVSADCGLEIEDEIAVSLVILDIVSAHNGNVPAEVVAYMNSVKSRAAEIRGEHDEAVNRIDGALKNLDKEEYLSQNTEDLQGSSLPEGVLPEATLPPAYSLSPGDNSSLPDIP